MQKVVAPKVEKRLPLYVKKQDMESLFSEVEFTNDFSGSRDKLILELFYCTHSSSDAVMIVMCPYRETPVCTSQPGAAPSCWLAGTVT